MPKQLSIESENNQIRVARSPDRCQANVTYVSYRGLQIGPRGVARDASGKITVPEVLRAEPLSVKAGPGAGSE
jgi:hypothetical protein